MPAVAAIIDYGNIPTNELVDESNATTPDVLVQSLTKAATREKRSFKNASGATFGLQYREPILTLSFDGYIANTTTGLANAEPGSAVTTLANFTASTFGFVPGDGTMVFEDPVRTESNEDMAKMTFNVVQYPFVS